jgi:hypothetical protein
VWLEATLTTDKDFKQLVRHRSDRTGESYTAARRRLLERRGPTMPLPTLRYTEKPEHGFSIAVPEDWLEEPPALDNSPYEVTRFRLHEGDAWHLALVFRRTDDAEPQVWLAANAARGRLKRSGFTQMSLAECWWGGGDGVRIDCQKEFGGPGGLWTVREYLTVGDGVVYALGLGTNKPENNGSLFDEIARRFVLLK